MLIPDLVVVHLENGQGFVQKPETQRPFFEWRTCLRHLVVSFDDAGFESLVDQGGILHRGEAAYRELLEIVCGLRSPLFGETEVFGQFKGVASSYAAPTPYWQGRFQKLFSQVLTDAKEIRQQHLRGCGSQSYGSFVRRQARGHNRIDILGAGHLALEILPWLSKCAEQVTIHCRRPEAVREQVKAPFQVRALSQPQSAVGEKSLLVIAAPLSAQAIIEWIAASGSTPDLVIDLRAESSTDVIAKDLAVIALQDVFSRLAQDRDGQELLRARAVKAIREKASARACAVEHRPFGWDELCAL